MAMELIETIEVGAGGAASIEFTSIPQDGVDLLCLFSLRSSTATSAINGKITINNIGTFTYNDKFLRGSGSAASSGGDTGANGFINFTLPGSTNTANTFANGAFYLSNYTSSTGKSVSMDVVYENNATAAQQNIYAGLQPTTSAVTSMKLIDPTGGSFVQYSTASLYKIS